MPSGSKKRKAAKKKKETQSNNHQDPSSVASAKSHGSDEVRLQDDKESDGGEVSSPASRDLHSQQNLLTEGEEEVIHEDKIVTPEDGVKIEAPDKTSIALDEVNVVSADREVVIADNYSNKQDGRFEHEETDKIAYNGGSSPSSGSSSSTSDDESHGVKSGQSVEHIPPVDHSATVPDSLSGRKVETIEDAGDSVVEKFPVIPDKVSFLADKVEPDINSLGIAASISPVKSMVEETAEKKPSSFDDKVAISTASKDASLEANEEQIIQSIEKIATDSDPPKVCVSQTTDDQLITSYNVPVATDKNGAEHVADSGVTEPVVHAAPRPLQTTSWKSCCGLFEVFTASGR